jgi:ABC-type glycerol-3-phosphate transport system permease component
MQAQQISRHPLAKWWASGRWVPVGIGVILTVAAVAMIYPFLWMVFGAFKSNQDIITQPIQILPREWTVVGFRDVWTQSGLPRAYANSMFVSGAIVITTLLTSSLGGYVFARLQFPGRQILFYFILATTMVPFVTLLIPLYLVMLDLGLLNSYAALWIPAGVSSFGIFLCRQFIIGIPLDLYEAAKLDGATDFGIYVQIILPLIRPVLAALAIFSFIGSFNSFLWPLVVLNDEKLFTLPLILVRITQTEGGTNYQAAMAGSVLASIPTVLIYLLFQKNFVKGIALSGIKG